LAFDHPLEPPQRRKEGGNGCPISEACVAAEELQAIGVIGFDQNLQKQVSKEAREHGHGKEVVPPT
jgi:hypothetical protein